MLCIVVATCAGAFAARSLFTAPSGSEASRLAELAARWQSDPATTPRVFADDGTTDSILWCDEPIAIAVYDVPGPKYTLAPGIALYLQNIEDGQVTYLADAKLAQGLVVKWEIRNLASDREFQIGGGEIGAGYDDGLIYGSSGWIPRNVRLSQGEISFNDDVDGRIRAGAIIKLDTTKAQLPPGTRVGARIEFTDSK